MLWKRVSRGSDTEEIQKLQKICVHTHILKRISSFYPDEFFISILEIIHFPNLDGTPNIVVGILSFRNNVGTTNVGIL